MMQNVHASGLDELMRKALLSPQQLVENLHDPDTQPCMVGERSCICQLAAHALRTQRHPLHTSCGPQAGALCFSRKAQQQRPCICMMELCPGGWARQQEWAITQESSIGGRVEQEAPMSDCTPFLAAPPADRGALHLSEHARVDAVQHERAAAGVAVRGIRPLRCALATPLESRRRAASCRHGLSPTAATSCPCHGLTPAQGTPTALQSICMHAASSFRDAFNY